ncbi:MAG: hypothetical protein ACI4SK_04170 [Christensenellales bacterium]
MKKQVCKAWTVVVMALLLLTLSGCNGYTSHYKAVAFVHTNTTRNASMSFSSFEGTMVFRLKCESADDKINYSAKLENGSAKVFYDCNGAKTELFFVDSGDEINGTGGVLQKGTVYIIVEMSEAGQDGNFSFDLA